MTVESLLKEFECHLDDLAENGGNILISGDMLDLYESLLIDQGFQPVEYSSRNTRNICYTKDECNEVFVSIRSILNKGTNREFSFAIVDRSFYENRFAGKKAILSVTNAGKANQWGKDRYRIYFRCGGIDKRLYHIVKDYENKKKAMGRNCVVDHVNHATQINTSDNLQIVTAADNNRNKKCIKNDSLYDSEDDFSKTVYVYFLWKMLGLMTEQEARDYNREHNK